ncbi:MAG TPA: metalloregulator ArsR/SmtB family transcription factor [Rectinemataceae bacterium]|nr:metalloregulator ArsR/SmtB family transcription factor [Rectinemataceae bacterium]
MENKYRGDAKVFKAFCDENRLSILGQLRDGEKCACVLLEKLNIAQSTLSHHMKILCESGVVTSRQEGKWIHYALSIERCDYVKKLIAGITAPINLDAIEKDCSCK